MVAELFGGTRSRCERDHALLTPDTHVQAPLPGWTNTMGIIVIAPRMGAKFVQYYALMNAGGSGPAPLPGIERFVYAVEGDVAVEEASIRGVLNPGGFAYFPANSHHRLVAKSASKLIIFEKRFVSLPGQPAPQPIIGHADQTPAAPFLGDSAAMLQKFLPDEPAFDMAVNLFTFDPGATLPFVEIHVMEHGLVMTAGQGIYRLNENWYPVQKDDVIWMAPYCPQWFVAVGKTKSGYLYYKDVNRDPLEAGV